MRILYVFAVLTLSLLPTLATPRDLGQWEASDADVRRWYQGLMQPDNPNVSCCGEADAYHADSFEVSPSGEYIAIITDDRVVDGRRLIEPGTRVVVPNHKLKWDRGNPTGHGVIFIAPAGQVLCYITPSGT